MSNLSTSNALMNSYNSSILDDGKFSELLGSSIEAQKSQLSGIFNVIDDNNLSAGDKKRLETKAAQLEKQLKTYQDQMDSLKAEIEENQDVVNGLADEIAGLITSVSSESDAMQKEQEEKVAKIIKEVFEEAENGDYTGASEISNQIRIRIAALPDPSGKIQKILDNLDAKQSKVDELINKASNWMDKIGVLEKNFGAIKATYTIITKNIAQIGETGTSYTNSDTDNKVPIYSLDKTQTVAELFDKFGGTPASNSNKKAGTTQPTKESIEKKYGNLYSTKPTSDKKDFDKNSFENKAVKNLDKALEDGLLDDLLAAGYDKEGIGKFLAKNFKGAGITYDKDGKLTVPKGHATAKEKKNGKTNANSKARATFDKVNDFFSKPSYVKNTWSDAGNTIDSNKQLKKLNGSYQDIFDKMSKDPKFTFKEAMYALFDPKVGMFKDCGIKFKLGEVDENGEPTYSIEPAGDEKTAKLYKGIAEQIKKIWGVEPKSTKFGAEKFDTNRMDVKDPMTFKIGNTEYAFVIDRPGADGQKDGKFSGVDELVGATGNWLEDLKSFDANGDGKLDAEELKNVMLLSSGYKDNAETQQNGAGFLRSETTNIDYSMVSAASLGITEIDLNAITGFGKNTGKTDINGSEIYEDGFSFNMGGKTIQASRKDDTSAFLDAVYAAASGKSFKVGQSKEEADADINAAYQEFDDWKNQFGSTLDNIENLKNTPDKIAGAKNFFTNAVDEMNDKTNAQTIRANNKAYSRQNDTDWGASMKAKVIAEANNRGIKITEDLLEQAKGAYESGGVYTASAILDGYQDLLDKEKPKTEEQN